LKSDFFYTRRFVQKLDKISWFCYYISRSKKYILELLLQIEKKEMLPSIIICAVTCLAMIASILFLPKIKIGKIQIDLYWVITLLGAATLLLSGQADGAAVGRALVADAEINPLKILLLFLSMTMLSVFLDELDFFRFLASAVLKRAHAAQVKLFVSLYLIVSVLTVFTSNDVIILSFTPFILYFSKNAKIDPAPYLAAEFVAANTWSMALIIGNPTNIYLATAYGLDFAGYLKISWLPTLCAGMVSFCALFLLFRKKLALPIEAKAKAWTIGDKFSLWVGVAHLGVCTVLLAVGSYIGIEMTPVAFFSAVSLAVWACGIALVRRQKPTALLNTVKRIPYQLIPFVLSMFVMISALSQNGATAAIAGGLGTSFSVWKYGVSAFLAANLINNIPMSILFSSVIEAGGAGLPAVFATVIGSNLGALFTPVGALAGIMWSSMLNANGVKFGYKDFLKLGVTVALPALAAALGGLELSLLLFGWML
jgi:arsenical pump membrane protein